MNILEAKGYAKQSIDALCNEKDSKKGWPAARDSYHHVVWRKLDVHSLAPTYGEAISIF